jgi:hypothetical protein
VSGEFANAVHRETEGNPFFVEEVLKALIEKGSVRRESGRWKRCDMDQLLIPQSVKEAIGNRLDRVSQKCNDVMRVSAVLGKVFSFEELTAAAEQNEDALLDAKSCMRNSIRFDVAGYTGMLPRASSKTGISFPVQSRSWPITTFRPAITNMVWSTPNWLQSRLSGSLPLTKRSRLTGARAIAPKRWGWSKNNSRRKKP